MYNSNIAPPKDYQEVIDDESRWGELDSLSRMTWDTISCSCTLPEKFIRQFMTDLNWAAILITKKLDTRLIKKMVPSVLFALTLEDKLSDELADVLKSLYKNYEDRVEYYTTKDMWQ